MNKKILFIPALLLALSSCGNTNTSNSTTPGSNNPSVITTPSVVNPISNGTTNNSTNTTPQPSTSNSTFEDTLVNLGGGKIEKSLPTGFTFFKGDHTTKDPKYYGNGGLKLSYINDGLLSNTFEAKNHVEVKLNILSINEKGNLETIGKSDFSYSIYGLNSENQVTAAVGVKTTKAARTGEFNLILNGPGITKVKFVYTASPYSDGIYYNASLGELSLKGNNSGSDEIINTEPVDPDDPIDNPVIPTEGKLNAPTNLQIDMKNWTISWDAVEHATSYRLFINDLNIIEETTSYTRDDVVFDAIKDGIINTIKVQALDNLNKYETSDLTAIQVMVPNTLKGLYINETLSNVKRLTVTKNEKFVNVVHIPSDKLSHDLTGGTPDIVLETDYDLNTYKFYAEKNDTLELMSKDSNKLSLNFKQPGEFIVDVVEKGYEDGDYVYDTIKFVVDQVTQISKLSPVVIEYDASYNFVENKTDRYEFNFNDNGGYIYFFMTLDYEGELDLENDVTITSSLPESSYTIDVQKELIDNKDGYYFCVTDYTYTSGTFTITFTTTTFDTCTLTVIVK